MQILNLQKIPKKMQIMRNTNNKFNLSKKMKLKFILYLCLQFIAKRINCLDVRFNLIKLLMNLFKL